MIAVDLSKQEGLDAAAKAIQQNNFIENLEQDAGATIFFIIEEAKETFLDFLQGPIKLWKLNFMSIIKVKLCG